MRFNFVSHELIAGETTILFSSMGNPQIFYQNGVVKYVAGLDPSVLNLFCSRHKLDARTVTMTPIGESIFNSTIILTR